MPRTVPTRVSLFLFLLFLLGLAVNALTFIDLHWTHWMLTRGDAPAGRGEPSTPAPVDAHQVQRLRQSILNVRIAQCAEGGENLGTGFVVKAGYVATAAHVLGDQQSCNGRIRLIDYRGREHPAILEGISPADDLALFRVSDASLPALQIADSTAYENPNELVRLVTIGYPLEQAGASAQDNAAISDEGTLSRFDREHNVFVTAGMSLNPGNSGGPIFLRHNWQVLGIARAKLSYEVGEGIGYVAPMRTFENFFREKTGQELR
jgi:S1-C subfamily serine protease